MVHPRVELVEVSLNSPFLVLVDDFSLSLSLWIRKDTKDLGPEEEKRESYVEHCSCLAPPPTYVAMAYV